MKTHSVGMCDSSLFWSLGACGGAEPRSRRARVDAALAPTQHGRGRTPPRRRRRSPQRTRAKKSTPEVDRAIAAIKANDFKSAKGRARASARENPKNGTASYYLGVALENLGDKAGAEQKYKDAISNAPDLDRGFRQPRRALPRPAADGTTRSPSPKRGSPSAPTIPALHANMAVALRGKGDKEGAAVEYERAVKVAGDNADLRYAYGSLLLEMGNKPKAADRAQGRARRPRAPIARFWRRSAGCSGPAGAFADCVAALDKAIAGGDDSELRVGAVFAATR